jgi:UDP-N-acetylmuramate dehydrogenase
LLQSLRGIDAQKDVLLAHHTNWKVGGPAELFVHANDVSSLGELLKIIRDEGLPLFILGNGSNILVSDSGLEGITMRLGGEFTSMSVNDKKLMAGGGAPLGYVVRTALKASLEGLEFAIGIPGTVGGSVMTNAGAFSGSIAEVVAEVETVAPNGEITRHSDIEDTYRAPLVPGNEIVTSAVFMLKSGPAVRIREIAESITERRKATQPWGMATAGSVFKNPPGDYAGRMIEECGLKGKSIGGARVSDMHANFITNDGTAKASDIKSLIDLARGEVKARFEIELELEIQLVGFDKE